MIELSFESEFFDKVKNHENGLNFLLKLRKKSNKKTFIIFIKNSREVSQDNKTIFFLYKKLNEFTRTLVNISYPRQPQDLVESAVSEMINNIINLFTLALFLWLVF